EVRHQGHTRRGGGGDDVAEVAEVLGQGEGHVRRVGQRRGVAGLDGPGLGEAKRRPRGYAGHGRRVVAGGGVGGVCLPVPEQGVGERVVGVAQVQDQVGAVRRAGVADRERVGDGLTRGRGRGGGGRFGHAHRRLEQVDAVGDTGGDRVGSAGKVVGANEG